ncbi:hypothetical protein GCM10010182_76930 [Actinomadura cremea]|nr:hypothetical protein GCM10010182_76930 [Actinomadura cremea]
MDRGRVLRGDEAGADDQHPHCRGKGFHAAEYWAFDDSVVKGLVDSFLLPPCSLMVPTWQTVDMERLFMHDPG